MSDNLLTFEQPVLKVDNAWKPQYDPSLDYDVLPKFFMRHYVQRYYTKGQLHYLWDKLTGKNPQSFQFWVEITIKNNAQTHDFIEILKSEPEVSEIPTPKEYEF